MYCFTITINGNSFTICIPLYYDPFWKWKHPDPRRVDDWQLVELQGVDRELMTTIVSLATIDSLARTVQPEFGGREFSTVVERGLASVNDKLPDGVSVQFRSAERAS